MKEIEIPTEKEIHDLACSKGWWDDPRSDFNIVGLIHSELSEALENYRRSGSIDHFFEELADTVIRSKDGIQAFKEEKIYYGFDPEDIPDTIGYLHKFLEQQIDDAPSLEFALLRFINEIFFRFDEHAIKKAIIEKHEFNKTREIRHGGKLC